MHSRAKALPVCACGRERQKASCPRDFGFMWAVVVQAVGGSRGRWLEGVEAPQVNGALPLLPAVSWVAGAVLGGTEQPLLPACHLPRLPRAVAGANKAPFVGRVGERSTVPCDLTFPRCEVGSEQAFGRLAPIRSPRLCPNGETLAFQGSVPEQCCCPGVAHLAARHLCGGAAGCRSLAGQEAARGSVAAPRRSPSRLR